MLPQKWHTYGSYGIGTLIRSIHPSLLQLRLPWKNMRHSYVIFTSDLFLAMNRTWHLIFFKPQPPYHWIILDPLVVQVLYLWDFAWLPAVWNLSRRRPRKWVNCRWSSPWSVWTRPPTRCELQNARVSYGCKLWEPNMGLWETIFNTQHSLGFHWCFFDGWFLLIDFITTWLCI